MNPLTGLCIILAIPISISLDKTLHYSRPDLMPYKWGYYTGAMGLMTYGLFSLLCIPAGLEDPATLALAFMFALLAVPFFFIIKRHRWAWVVGSILLLNPISWIINFIYAKNRWEELGKTE